ncbi:hypothetical protein N6B72_17645 [Chryseobacterium soli]|uniref:hypothetical protein n=1 Tax=Chryseobacterium soli TaxID=445961 RepID=UPI002955C5AB|nr:hypothetical protein [Chryseobacterium soli]MDV7698753.1 hypothetical protein [Chryseobacterium soli]
MEAAKCKVVCKIDYDYTSSEPIISSTAYYKIKDSLGSSIEYTKSPAPSNMDEVTLEGIQSADTYELTVALTVNGVTDEETVMFQVDKCMLTSCKAPSIDNVYLGANDQIIMDYTVDSNNFYAVEYQIAKDAQFNDIVHFRVIMESDYNPTEYIEMNDGTIEPGTAYLVRARKHCSTSEVSDWSNVAKFTSGKWQKSIEAFCLANYDDFSQSICDGVDDYAWKTRVTLSTNNPGVGSLIYLANGTPATIDNLRVFGQSVTVPGKFQDNGIRWIRFSNVTPSVVYDVEPRTGKIESISSFTC